MPCFCVCAYSELHVAFLVVRIPTRLFKISTATLFAYLRDLLQLELSLPKAETLAAAVHRALPVHVRMARDVRVRVRVRLCACVYYRRLWRAFRTSRMTLKTHGEGVHASIHMYCIRAYMHTAYMYKYMHSSLRFWILSVAQRLGFQKKKKAAC